MVTLFKYFCENIIAEYITFQKYKLTQSDTNTDIQKNFQVLENTPQHNIIYKTGGPFFVCT